MSHICRSRVTRVHPVYMQIFKYNAFKNSTLTIFPLNEPPPFLEKKHNSVSLLQTVFSREQGISVEFMNSNEVEAGAIVQVCAAVCCSVLQCVAVCSSV